MMDRNFYIRILDLLHYDHLPEHYHELSMKFDHILALVLYCDYSQLCTDFSASFRKKNVFETLKSVKHRNSNYFWFSKSLRETVELFGNSGYYKKEKDDILERGDGASGPFYCGMNQLMVMDSFCIRLSSPTSTSRKLSVAMKFGGDDGIIIQFKNDIGVVNEYLCGFCCTLSDYVEESETLFFGGFAPIHIESVRIRRTSENFKKYCAALYYLDSILSGAVVKIDEQSKKENFEIISQILSYRLGENVKLLPQYIKQTVDAFMNSKSQIIVNLADIYDHSDKNVVKLLMYEIVPKKYSNNDYFASSQHEELNENLLKPLIFDQFRNVKTVTIITTNAKNNTSFPLSLFALLPIITKLKKVIIEAIVYDPFAVPQSGVQKQTWISSLYSSSLFGSIKAAFLKKNYMIEYTSARTVTLSQKHSFVIIHKSEQTEVTQVKKKIAQRDDFYVTAFSDKKRKKLKMQDMGTHLFHYTKIDQNTTNEYGLHALHYAAKYGQIETIKSLIEKKIDINIKDDDGFHALHFAAWKGHTETVKFLLYQGVDMNVKANIESHALHFAAENGHTETVKFLLDRGVDMNVEDNEEWHALHYAAWNGHTEMVKFLLDRGVDINVKDNKGKQALHHAACYGHTETVKFLLDRGVDINVKNNNGYHALHYAARGGHTEIVKFLLDGGVDMNVKDGEGWHALHYAARDGHTETVKFLLDRGVDINVKDDKGWHVLHYAAWIGHTEVVKFLLDRGVDMNVKDNNGNRAVDYAEMNSHSQIVQLLTTRK